MNAKLTYFAAPPAKGVGLSRRKRLSVALVQYGGTLRSILPASVSLASSQRRIVWG